MSLSQQPDVSGDYRAFRGIIDTTFKFETIINDFFINIRLIYNFI